MLDPPLDGIAKRFLGRGRVAAVQRLGNGLINETFLVTSDSCDIPRFVLQKINNKVFPFPERILANLEQLTRHLAERVAAAGQSARGEDFRLPELLPSTDGRNCVITESGECWRALTYIGNSEPLHRLESRNDAEQVGFALGRFHNLVRDLDSRLMQDSLPGFHRTPAYLSQYDRLRCGSERRKLPGSPSDLRMCEDFVLVRRALAAVFEQGELQGRLLPRVVHGDPKLNNILFDRQSRKAVAMIDLDTVKSGLIQYDIGDCLRSSCNAAGESGKDPGSVRFDLDRCEAILVAYFHECGPDWSAVDLDYLYDAVRILPFELGLRFLSDYLDGNRYFRTEFPDHNLIRAQVQFSLVHSVEEQETQIRSLIRKVSSGLEAR
ncbi:MAG: phosphotransferase enzyme family protein [Gammaproteobacteria bacterium]